MISKVQWMRRIIADGKTLNHRGYKGRQDVFILTLTDYVWWGGKKDHQHVCRDQRDNL